MDKLEQNVAGEGGSAEIGQCFTQARKERKAAELLLLLRLVQKQLQEEEKTKNWKKRQRCC